MPARRQLYRPGGTSYLALQSSLQTGSTHLIHKSFLVFVL
jgi:hypothetical protein